MKVGKKTYLWTSPEVYAYTSGAKGKYTNPKSVTVKKTNVALKKGKTYKIKASVKKLENNNVYAYAQNGIFEKIRVDVK